MALVFGAACTPPAAADEPSLLQTLLRFDINRVAAGQQSTPIPEATTKAFGERGGERLTLNIGVAEDEGTATDLQLLAVAWSRFVVEDVEVLVEGPSKSNDTRWSGRTRDHRIVVWPRGKADLRGQRVEVEIENATALTLSGRACAGADTAQPGG